MVFQEQCAFDFFGRVIIELFGCLYCSYILLYCHSVLTRDM